MKSRLSSTRSTEQRSTWLFFRQIQPAALQFLELRKMIRPQGLADPVFLGKPAAQIHHLATLGTRQGEVSVPRVPL